MASDLTRTALFVAGLLWVPSLVAEPHPESATGPAGTEDEVVGDEVLAQEDVEGYETIVKGDPNPRTTSSEFTLRGLPLAVSPRRSGAEMLRAVPGLVVVQHGSEGKGLQFFLRGFDAVHGSDVEVTVGGIPINEVSNIHAQGYVDLGFVVPEAVTGIRVPKGPFRIDQGPFANAGSIRYDLGVSTDLRGTYVGYETGTSNRHRVVASVSPRDPLKDNFIAVEGVRDNGFGENRAHRRLSLMGRFTAMEDDSAGRLDLLVSAHGARFGLPGLVRLDDVKEGSVVLYDACDPEGVGTSDRGTVALDYRLDREVYSVDVLAWGMVRHLELNENFTGFLDNPIRGDKHRQHHETISGGVSASSRADLHPTLVILALGGYRLEWLDQAMDTIDTRGVPWNRTRALTGYQHLAHLGLGLDWTPLEELRVEAGLRVDVMSVSADNHVDDISGSGTVYHLGPRFTMSGSPGGGWTLFASYGRGWRPPEAAAFVAPPPASDEVTMSRPVRGTSSHVAEVGVHWGLRRILHLGLTGFGVFVYQEQIFNHAAGTSEDVGGTRRLGVEAVISSTPLSWLEIRADLTWVKACVTQTGDPIPGVPPLAGGIQASLVHPLGFRFGARFVALAARPLAFGAQGSTMYRLDLTTGYRWKWLDVGIEIDNVLGREIREGEYNFASHWNSARAASRIPAIHVAPGPPFTLRGRVAVIF